MILRELVEIAAGNLWRRKLRTTLTAVGVMVGIGALTAMLSFAFGMQRAMTTEFRRIGLFRTIQVLPGTAPDSTRGPGPRVLDERALEELAAIPGVSLAYPQQSFDASLTFGDTTRAVAVQALPADFVRHRPIGPMVAGRFFEADSAAEMVLSSAWLKKTGIPLDSILNRTVRIRTVGGTELVVRLGERYLEQYGLPSALLERAGSLILRVAERLRPSACELRVVGVAEVEWGFGFRLGEILVPTGIARRFDTLPISDPMELLALSSGSGGSGWSMIIVTLAEERAYDRVHAAIRARGYSTLSFPEQFEQMRKQFLLFDAFVLLLGMIALFVASLGIANTMVMSILERTREIGILKSLGAEDEQIRWLFLVESAAIGLLGSIGGVILGWLVSRLAAAVGRRFMEHRQIPPIDPFYLPFWVVLAAIAFGTLLSVLAGLYPAGRAARIDPVRALRQE